MTTPNNNILEIISKKYIQNKVDEELDQIYAYCMINPVIFSDKNFKIVKCKNEDELMKIILFDNISIIFTTFMLSNNNDNIIKKYTSSYYNNTSNYDDLLFGKYIENWLDNCGEDKEYVYNKLLEHTKLGKFLMCGMYWTKYK